ncbi:unnamed protein product [Trichobilharzia szidati]|nr:unnamed protein product [Trichobilharzia szidati]
MILTGIIILLWSLDIILLCCDNFKYPCYILIGFIILEDLLTIIFCFLTKRLIRVVEFTMLSISLACFIAVIIIYFLKRDEPLWLTLAGGLWNTSVILVSSL